MPSARLGLCATVLLTGCAAGSHGSAQPRVLAYVCEDPAYRPATLLIACGDGNVRVRGLSWSRWTDQRATGTGVWQQNDCVPYCAAGTFHDYPVRLELESPMTLDGRPVFGDVTAYFTGKAPDGAVAGKEPVTRGGKYPQ